MAVRAAADQPNADADAGSRPSGEASRQLISRLQEARERSAQLRTETAKILSESGVHAGVHAGATTQQHQTKRGPAVPQFAPATGSTWRERGDAHSRPKGAPGTATGTASPSASTSASTPLPCFPLPSRDLPVNKHQRNDETDIVTTKRLQGTAKDEARTRPRKALPSTATAAAAAAASARSDCYESRTGSSTPHNTQSNRNSNSKRGSTSLPRASVSSVKIAQPDLPQAPDSPAATVAETVVQQDLAQGRWGRPVSPSRTAETTRRLLRVRLCTLDFEPSADGSFAAPALLETWGIRAMLHLRSDAPVKWNDFNPVTQHRQQLRFGRAVSWDGSYTPQVRLDFDEEVDIPLPANFPLTTTTTTTQATSGSGSGSGSGSDSPSQAGLLGPLAVDLWLERRTIAEKLDTFLDRVGWGNNLPEFDRTWLGRAICSLPAYGQDTVPEKWVVIANTNITGHHPRWLSLGFEWVTEEVTAERKQEAADPEEVVVTEYATDAVEITDGQPSLKENDGIEVTASKPGVAVAGKAASGTGGGSGGGGACGGVPVCSLLWPSACLGF